MWGFEVVIRPQGLPSSQVGFIPKGLMEGFIPLEPFCLLPHEDSFSPHEDAARPPFRTWMPAPWSWTLQCPTVRKNFLFFIIILSSIPLEQHRQRQTQTSTKWESVNRMGCIWAIKCHSTIIRKKFWHSIKWMSPNNLMLAERRQSQKTIHYAIPFVWNVQNRPINRDRKSITSLRTEDWEALGKTEVIGNRFPLGVTKMFQNWLWW
jgi:hypothetical protein